MRVRSDMRSGSPDLGPVAVREGFSSLVALVWGCQWQDPEAQQCFVFLLAYGHAVAPGQASSGPIPTGGLDVKSWAGTWWLPPSSRSPASSAPQPLLLFLPLTSGTLLLLRGLRLPGEILLVWSVPQDCLALTQVAIWGDGRSWQGYAERQGPPRSLRACRLSGVSWVPQLGPLGPPSHGRCKQSPPCSFCRTVCSPQRTPHTSVASSTVSTLCFLSGTLWLYVYVDELLQINICVLVKSRSQGSCFPVFFQLFQLHLLKRLFF